MSTSGNRIDANLIAANIRAGVTIYWILWTFNGFVSWGGLGNFLGTFSQDEGEHKYTTTDRRTIDIGDGFIYMFATCNRAPGGSSERGASCIAAKIEISTGIVTICGWNDRGTVTSGSTPTLASSYVDGTGIYLNYTGWGGSCYFYLETTTDTLTSVNSATYTSWVLTNTTSVSSWWNTYETFSSLEQYIAASSSVGNAFSWYFTIT